MPWSENFPVVSVKKTSLLFPKMGRTKSRCRRVSREVFCSSRHGVREQKASKAHPVVSGHDKVWGQTRPAAHLRLTLCPSDPCLPHTMPVCLLSRDAASSGPGQPLQHVWGLWGRAYHKAATHHSLSNGNKWEAAAFSLLVFLGHFAFCSSLASRF